MLTITPIIPLDDGRKDWFLASLASYNQTNNTELTAEEFVTLRIIAEAEAGKQQAIEGRAAKMAATARLLPDVSRVQLTDDIAAVINAAVKAHAATLDGEAQASFLAAVLAINS